MTTKSDYTPEEWKLLMDIPPLVGTAVMVAGRSGVTGSMKEAFAVAQSVLGGRHGYQSNELIQSLVDARVKDGEKSEVEQMSGNSYRGLPPEELLSTVLQMCEDVRVMLDEKSTPEESEGFRSWSVAVGDKVANAAKEGGFIERITGSERVSEDERQVLTAVSKALGVSSPA